MASKLQFISELASHTAKTVTRDVDGWKRYLTTASRLYQEWTAFLSTAGRLYKDVCCKG